MSYALARRDELNVANTTHENALADIKSDTIHNIIHVITRLNKRGVNANVSFHENEITITVSDGNTYKSITTSHGYICLSTAAELIDALRQLEELENNLFLADTVKTFAKEDDKNA